MADVASNNQYSIRPNYKHKFKPAIVTRLIHQVLAEKLTGVAYNPESCSQWTREISDEVKARLKGLELSRYKFVVNVVIGEMRGEGVRFEFHARVSALSNSRFLDRSEWDAGVYGTQIQDVFMNDSLFCVAVAYGVYYY
ncbi:hypothetical protein CcCBS67573_g08157 [Chytriomyces confervae]|uniref:Topoisomerase I damage affected protein 2 n=1 Tax=Chytriomyces confervae TaxID=246404 RepID=A0A507EPX9_9FUNG|nr:hypothetical protein CcCBS67573_g08157 [Chytriomyces confervae]